MTARNYFEFIRFIENSMNGVNAKGSVNKYLDELKRTHRKQFKGQDSLTQSLCDEWRITGDYESVTKYAIFEDNGETDEELDEFIEEMCIVNPYSAYDCTGRPFTISIRWKRMPVGIAVIHHIGYDF